MATPQIYIIENSSFSLILRVFRWPPQKKKRGGLEDPYTIIYRPVQQFFRVRLFQTLFWDKKVIFFKLKMYF